MSDPRRPRKSSVARLVAAVVVSVIVVGVSTVAVLAAAVYSAGTVEVEVQEAGGERVSIAVPTTLVSAAVKFIPDHLYVEAAEEAAPYWEACRAAVREIARCPDAILVQVDGPDLEVRVAKDDGRLLVDVTDSGTRVHVSVPVATVVEIVEKIELRL